MSESPGGWQRINLLELADEPTEPPRWAGLVYAGRRHLFSGEPETAKTIAALAIAHAVVRECHDVLYLDYEMGAPDALARLREMGFTDHDLARIHYYEPDSAPHPKQVAELVTSALALAVLDAASGSFEASDLDDTRTRDVERWARLHIKPLHQAGVATIVIDHVVKNADSRGKYASGNHRKVGGVDVHLTLETKTPFHRGHDGLTVIHTKKDRPGHLARPRAAEIELRSTDGGHIAWTFRNPSPTPTTNSGSFRPTLLMGRVSDYLAMQPEPVSLNAVQKAVSGNKDYITVAIACLVAEGYAREEAGARRARLLTFVKPFNPDTTSPTSADLGPTSARPKSDDFGSSAHPLQGGRSPAEVGGTTTELDFGHKTESTW